MKDSMEDNGQTSARPGEYIDAKRHRIDRQGGQSSSDLAGIYMDVKRLYSLEKEELAVEDKIKMDTEKDFQQRIAEDMIHNGEPGMEEDSSDEDSGLFMKNVLARLGLDNNRLPTTQ